ncbi:MAG: galactose mutarotase [Clostridia bacterium]|nr:galactose mutarotase [Clostridia bacterium]
MRNENGMLVTVLDLGATVQSVFVPDKSGTPTDVVLGYDTVAGYEGGTCYYGAVVGRCTNRIGNARFVLDGKEYALEKTPGEENHVHGIFNKKIFRTSLSDGSLVLCYHSPSMEEGFPGNVDLEVRYSLSEDNALEISYKAVTDAPTVLNVTNHSYFNLNGQDGSTIFDHKLCLNSGFYTEYTPSFAQTGRIIPVEGTPLDFRTEHTIGERFLDDYPQLRLCTGYDHNMVLDGKEGDFKPIGTLKSEKTGICLEAFTTEPAIHFYSGNYMHLDAVPNGKRGVHFPKNGAVCLEAQHYPDAINHPQFPSTVLRPGETYRQKTVYRFKVK